MKIPDFDKRDNRIFTAGTIAELRVAPSRYEEQNRFSPFFNTYQSCNGVNNMACKSLGYCTCSGKRLDMKRCKSFAVWVAVCVEVLPGNPKSKINSPSRKVILDQYGNPTEVRLVESFIARSYSSALAIRKNVCKLRFSFCGSCTYEECTKTKKCKKIISATVFEKCRAIKVSVYSTIRAD